MKQSFNPWAVVSVVLVGVMGYGIFYVVVKNNEIRERDAATLKNWNTNRNYNTNAAPIVPFPNPSKKTVHV